MPLPDFLPGRFALSRGRPGDYFALEHFHYLPRRPATYADVWVVTYADDSPPFPRVAPPLAAGSPRGRDVTLRFHGDPPQAAGLHGAAHDAREARWRCAARRDALAPGRDVETAPRLVAVGVLSFPTFRSRPRERVLGLGAMSHRDRLALVNANLRTISRVVVHPQFRSLGLASELVRALIAACPTRYVEASAVMARVHPFFEAAGMRRVKGERSKNTGRGDTEGDDEQALNPSDRGMVTSVTMSSNNEDKDEDDDSTPAYFIFDKEEGSPCGS